MGATQIACYRIHSWIQCGQEALSAKFSMLRVLTFRLSNGPCTHIVYRWGLKPLYANPIKAQLDAT